MTPKAVRLLHLCEQRSTTDSLGNPLGSTKEEIEAFWKWFGTSKVVDDKGRPLVVFHATTAKFDKFSGSNRYYFAPNRRYVENEYHVSGGRIISAYLLIENPDLVKRIDGEFLSPAQVQAFKDAGHDGYGIREIGGKVATEYVVFNPNQIKVIAHE